MATKKALVVLSALIVVLSVSAFTIKETVITSGADIISQLRLLLEAYNIVRNYYVDEVSNAQLVDGAIRGMLNELDPHTVYIPSEKVSALNERTAGYFYGVGIEFVMQNKIPTVIAPIVGGPSELLGIRSGDRILKIDNETTYNMPDEEVEEKLRGAKGSKVVLTVKRPGIQQPFKINIRRERIPIYSIICQLLLENRTGYIRIGNFSQTTAQELDRGLLILEKLGMQRLLLDLRSNSGGLLEQACAVADKFLPGGRNIVYTEGRTQDSREHYYSTDNNTCAKIPLIVLIDGGSASAAEIVAGALQDWDRGLIVGETSFGKAFVQRQLPLSDGSALRVTVARYYTPIGRLIQRSDRNELLDYYDYESDEDWGKVTPTSNRPVFRSKGGRIIYGGGGIVPDFTLSGRELTSFTHYLQLHNVFFEYASIFTAKNRTKLPDYRTFKETFDVNDTMLAEFHRVLLRKEIAIDEDAYRKDRHFYKHQIKCEIARHMWNSQSYYEVQLMNDVQVQNAMRLFNKAMLLVAEDSARVGGASQASKKY